ncbi:hypothetical protein PIB30_050507 [Stylosanthes scabra]|uniref:Uncharacterized protein n=1 Tax=Stylosanthes scabra TaxID=79078 RepID=A0ABU6SHI0_9FABA|nr:hypothetical protein [Stylosanthes scabra]
MLVQRTKHGRKGVKIGEEKQHVNGRNEAGRNVATKGNASRFAILQENDTEIIKTNNHETSVAIVSSDKREPAKKVPQNPHRSKGPQQTITSPQLAKNNPQPNWPNLALIHIIHKRQA